MSSQSSPSLNSALGNDANPIISRHSTPSVASSAVGLEDKFMTGPGFGSGGEMVNTRSGAKEGSAKDKSSSRASACGEKGKQKATASTSVKLAMRSAKPANSQPDPVVEEGARSGDEEGDDENDNDDGAHTRPQNPLAHPALATAREVFSLWLPFEPSHHSFGEMTAPNLRGRSETSSSFRKMVLATTQLTRTTEDLEILRSVHHVQGAAWSGHMAASLETRWRKIHADWYAYAATVGMGEQYIRGTDVDTTMERIPKMFQAIMDTIHHFPRIERHGLLKRLIAVLIEMLETIVRYTHDVRGRSATQPAYAGGSTQFEYVLYLRFARAKEIYLPCLEVIRFLGSKGHAEFFRQDEARWKALYQALCTFHEELGSFPGESEGFVEGLRQMLEGLGVSLT